MAAKEIRVPDLGNFEDVAVIDVLVKPGETVQVDTPLITLETDKATMDVPSTDAGTVQQLHVAKGSTVSAGSLIATLEVSGEPAATSQAAAKAPSSSAPAQASASAAGAPAAAGARERGAAAPAAGAAHAAAATTGAAEAHGSRPTARAAVPAAAPGPAPALDEQAFVRAHASPSVRKLARELGVDLALVHGSGQKSRVTEEDVKGFVKSVIAGAAGAAGAAAALGGARGLPQVVAPDFAQYGAVEVRPLGRVQRISGARLHASWVNLPHVTQFEEADISELEAVRERLKGEAQARGIRLTLLAFIVRACAMALRQFPLFNSSLDASGEQLVYKRYVHIGFAADTPNGLLVPVIRDADRKDVYELARLLGELAGKARSGKLAAAEMQGGSFSISSLGGIGGTAFTPIINAPEVAILGVSRSSMKPVYRGGQFVPRLMMPLSLSYDHRVIDGANGARFCSYLAGALADASGLLEAVP